MQIYEIRVSNSSLDDEIYVPCYFVFSLYLHVFCELVCFLFEIILVCLAAIFPTNVCLMLKLSLSFQLERKKSWHCHIICFQLELQRVGFEKSYSNSYDVANFCLFTFVSMAVCLKKQFPCICALQSNSYAAPSEGG